MSLLGSDRSGIYTHSLTLIVATECDKPGSGERCCGQVLGDSGQAQSLISHQSGSCLVSRKEKEKEAAVQMSLPFWPWSCESSSLLTKKESWPPASECSTQHTSRSLPVCSGQQQAGRPAHRAPLLGVFPCHHINTNVARLPSWPSRPCPKHRGDQSYLLDSSPPTKKQCELHLSTQL